MKTIVSANAGEHSADKEDVTEFISSASSLKSKTGSLQETSISSIFSLLTSFHKQASLEVNFAILIFTTLPHTHIQHF